MKHTREKQQLEVAGAILEAISKLPKQNFTPQTIVDACKNSKVWLLRLENYPKEETPGDVDACTTNS